MAEGLDGLRFGDLMTLLAVRRHSSITAAARALRVTPSQVSKAVARLESIFGVALLERTRKGVAISEQGARLLPRVEAIVEQLQRIEPGAEITPEITVAAPSYLSNAFVAPIAQRLSGVRVRGIELPPALIRAFASEGQFEFALSLGPSRFPRNWSSTKVGEVRSGLYASPAVAKSLGKGPVAPEKVAALPFVQPLNAFQGQIVRVDDGCPLGNNRKRGHEAQTIAIGLSVAARTGQLVFGPSIAAAAAVARGQVVEIPVRGWDVRQDLFVSCEGDRVMAKVGRAVCEAVGEEIAALEKVAPRTRS
ncbi:MAG TPA: LysR family transcriptional regulator [bacterium]|nr:LysR family transcriptional regulator [bacterium]